MMYSRCWACDNNKVLVVLIYKVYHGCNIEVLDNLIEKDGTKKKSLKRSKKKSLNICVSWTSFHGIVGTNLICKE